MMQLTVKEHTTEEGVPGYVIVDESDSIHEVGPIGEGRWFFKSPAYAERQIPKILRASETGTWAD